MLIVADRVNTSYPGIDEAIETRNVRFIQDVARSAAARGAHMIDLNCGTRIKSEGEDLEWLVGVTQEATGLPMSIDTPNPVAMRQALEVHNGRALLNSATAEKGAVRASVRLGQRVQFNGCGACHG
jgi:cobalamin-dependent methionine synthase I